MSSSLLYISIITVYRLILHISLILPSFLCIVNLYCPCSGTYLLFTQALYTPLCTVQCTWCRSCVSSPVNSNHCLSSRSLEDCTVYIVHWRCGGSLIAHQTSVAEVPGSKPASPTMILMRGRIIVNNVEKSQCM